MGEPLLEIRNLKTCFYTEDGVVPAIENVSFSLDKGETIGIVGESGSGKSVTALSVMRLIPNPPGRIECGEIIFEGENLLEKRMDQMRGIRGNDIAMIFQEPMTSLNPVLTVGDQIMEAILLHQKLSKQDAKDKAVHMLRLVGIPSPERRVNDYPHQMSGGMRQRVMIAMALSCNPKLLIADEPTTALDVTVQAQILELMMALKDDLGTSVMLITHDLGVIAETADKVVVMYAGNVVEKAGVRELFREPAHPYTMGLLGSIPKLNEDSKRLQSIEGVVPSPFNMPKGCRFSPRCGHAMDICREREPVFAKIADGHHVSCWKYAAGSSE
ncbi:MAG: ABC transporter ATP-binding protein [Bacillota bacterium]|jgi:oligopeptide/dipeptide ABC transporter ATP-binding protein|nr:ABC transporter ATP-binding protein [Bacillota bacterium]NLH88092.1 ABC transporter ATP-binding protein [Bacillota bacterium]